MSLNKSFKINFDEEYKKLDEDDYDSKLISIKNPIVIKEDTFEEEFNIFR
jgi:hypothetical protein